MSAKNSEKENSHSTLRNTTSPNRSKRAKCYADEKNTIKEMEEILKKYRKWETSLETKETFNVEKAFNIKNYNLERSNIRLTKCKSYSQRKTCNCGIAVIIVCRGVWSPHFI